MKVFVLLEFDITGYGEILKIFPVDRVFVPIMYTKLWKWKNCLILARIFFWNIDDDHFMSRRLGKHQQKSTSKYN